MEIMGKNEMEKIKFCPYMKNCGEFKEYPDEKKAELCFSEKCLECDLYQYLSREVYG